MSRGNDNEEICCPSSCAEKHQFKETISALPIHEFTVYSEASSGLNWKCTSKCLMKVLHLSKIRTYRSSHHCAIL